MDLIIVVEKKYKIQVGMFYFCLSVGLAKRDEPASS